MNEQQVRRLLGSVVAISTVSLIHSRPTSPHLLQLHAAAAVSYDSLAARVQHASPRVDSVRLIIVTPSGQKPNLFTGRTDADLLYRRAREAMVNNEDARAIAIFENVAQVYPHATYAPSALYYRAFLQYRQYHPGAPATLRSALTTLRQLRRQYPKAPQLADAQTLETRICGELAQLGDTACRTQVVRAARFLTSVIDGAPVKANLQDGPDSSGGLSLIFALGSSFAFHNRECHNQKMLERLVATLESLWKVNSMQAMQTTGQVLANRDPCFANLREQALLIITQRSTPVMAMAPAVFDAARKDPSPTVRQLAKLWLLSQKWDPEAANFLHAIFGAGFKTKLKV